MFDIILLMTTIYWIKWVYIYLSITHKLSHNKSSLVNNFLINLPQCSFELHFEFYNTLLKYNLSISYLM